MRFVSTGSQMTRNDSTHAARTFRRGAIGVLAGLAGVLGGCAADVQPLNVVNFYGLKIGDECGVATGDALVRGSYDPNWTDPATGRAAGYVVGIELENGLSSTVTQPGALPVRAVSTNTAQITGLTTKYSWSPASGTSTVEIPDRTFPVTAIVKPGESARLPAQILSGVDAAQLRGKTGTVTVEIKVTGTLSDGSAISSTPARFSFATCPDCISDACPDGQALSLPCGLEAGAQPDGRKCVSATAQ